MIPGVISCVGVMCLFARDEAKKGDSPTAPVYPVQRYESLWKHSLFGRTHAATTKAAPSEWNLAGVFEIDGKKGAILLNEKTGAVENVTVDEPNDSGIQLVIVQPGGKGAPPRVQISQNGKNQWVTSRKIESSDPAPATPNRALVNTRDGRPAPRLDDTQSESQAAAAARRNQPENLAPPSPLDVPSIDVPLPLDPTGPSTAR